MGTCFGMVLYTKHRPVIENKFELTNEMSLFTSMPDIEVEICVKTRMSGKIFGTVISYLRIGSVCTKN